MHWIAYLAASASLALGLLGLFAPHAAVRLTGIAIREDLAHSVSEVRATYGGFFIGLSLAVLILGAPLAAWVLACGWLAAGLTRIISTRLDNALNLPNIAGIVVELAIGGGLLV
jgi:hypothetical protein